MKRFLTPVLIAIVAMCATTACTSRNTTTVADQELPEQVLNRDWVHAYWLAPEPQRVYIPISEDEFDSRLTDGLRFNDDSVYLQYRFQRDGSRSTEVGNWIWLADKSMLQVTFENDKEAVNFKINSVTDDRLEVEVVPDDY
ncbi:hypothetical protein AB9P05_03390 [Roseivirga sp. BDSF3-8]|uniref:hypothetical protein n=1 Tax=Roseivirga sp. BDSF3-8 TaxID=3241598 RepID=UPI003531FEDE